MFTGHIYFVNKYIFLVCYVGTHFYKYYIRITIIFIWQNPTIGVSLKRGLGDQHSQKHYLPSSECHKHCMQILYSKANPQRNKHLSGCLSFQVLSVSVGAAVCILRF